MKITSFLLETSVENRVKFLIRRGELKIYVKEPAPAIAGTFNIER